MLGQVKKLRYPGEHKREISMPMGGIGTGCIGLAGNGALKDLEIFGRPNKLSGAGFTFFAVKAEKDGKIADIRALMTDAKTTRTGFDKMPTDAFYENFGWGPGRDTLGGFPHFPDSDFIASYPFGELDLAYEKFPGKIHLTAFNPFIPLSDTDSGIPAVMMEYAVKNDTEASVDYTFYGVLQNPFDRCVHTFRDSRNEKIKTVTLGSIDRGLAVNEMGEMAIGVCGDDVKFQEYWLRGAWFEALQTFWNDINAGELQNRVYEPEAGCRDVCTISTRVRLDAGESKKVRFVIAWYYPYNINDWDPVRPPEEALDPALHTKEQIESTRRAYIEKNIWKNYYTRYIPSAADCAYYCLSQWDRLYEETDRFRSLLFSSTLPAEVLDAVSANLSVLKSPTCMRYEDGSFYGFEGCGREKGSCEGTCTHVWNYAYALPYLFPKLERSIRTNHYQSDIAIEGALRFRTVIPLPKGRDEPILHVADRMTDIHTACFPCADGQFGDVLKVYREFKLCGDVEWLRSLWNDLARSIEFAWHPKNPFLWDPDKTGVLSGRQHHTLDVELFSPNPWLDGLYVAALKAGAELALVVKDKKRAAVFSELYEKGRKYLNEALYNGKYFCQAGDATDPALLYPFVTSEDKQDESDPVNAAYRDDETGELKYQIGEGCSIDQVLAQWHADILGLGDVFDREKVRSALKTVYETNFRSMRDFFNPCRLFAQDDERGVVICAYPEGAKKPKIPIPYAEECMSGFEYAVASHMLMNGMVDEGLAIVRAVRERYDGRVRNPWNEMECGSNYARSMASYALLGAICGQTIDVYNKSYRFCPDMRFSENGVFRCFVCFESFLGFVERGVDYIQLKCLKGGILVRRFETPTEPLLVKAGGHEIGFEREGNIAVFDHDTEIDPTRDLLVVIRT